MKMPSCHLFLKYIPKLYYFYFDWWNFTVEFLIYALLLPFMIGQKFMEGERLY